MSSLPKKQKVISTDLTNTSTIKFTINVTPKTKKNSQQIVIVHNRPIIIPSKYYKQIVATMDGSKVLWDKENSRTEIEITKLSDYQQW